MLKVLDTTTETEETPATPTLDDLAREGARRMLMAALQVEVATSPRLEALLHESELVPLRDRCGFGRLTWLISQVSSVTYVAG